MSDRNTGLNVSRETLARLETYAELLQKWNPKINLVAKSTLDDLWTRHIVDSEQVFGYAPSNVDHWVDIGSGGGFPGLVIAILRDELAPKMNVTLIESDQRKCTFLRTVLRETGVSATVIADRIEQVPPQNADVLSARALADLSMLLGFAKRHLSDKGTALFQKGARWEKEVLAAQESWSFSVDSYKSKTEASAVILDIKGIQHV